MNRSNGKLPIQIIAIPFINIYNIYRSNKLYTFVKLFL